MVVADIMEEEASSPAQEGPIDSRNGTAKKRPLFVAVVSNRGIGMMEEG